MHPVEPKRVEEAFHVEQQFLGRPLMVGAGVRGLSVTAHIAPNQAYASGEQWHPVVPEARIAAEAVLNP
jgi:hypothetical protein